MTQGASGYEPSDAWWYVGRFMWDFAVVEMALDEVVQDLLGVDFGAYVILAQNLSLSGKVRIVNSFLKNAEDRARRDQEIQDSASRLVLSKLNVISGLRNTMAHAVFTDDDQVGEGGPGLTFDDWRGKLSADGIWSKAITFNELDQIHRDIPDLRDRIIALKAACRRLSALRCAWVNDLNLSRWISATSPSAASTPRNPRSVYTVCGTASGSCRRMAQSRFQWNAPAQVVFGTSHGLRGRCLSLAHSRYAMAMRLRTVA